MVGAPVVEAAAGAASGGSGAVFISGEEMMKSAEARLQATGMLHTTATRSRALTSGSWG